MTPLFKKLNYKNEKVIVSLHTPETFDTELHEMSKMATIVRDESQITDIDFILIFVTTEEEISSSIRQINPKLRGDAVVWYCYPKGTSKKYKCNINRDNGWNSIREYDFETVRQVAIDEDWSALRFRKMQYIKSLTRK